RPPVMITSEKWLAPDHNHWSASIILSGRLLSERLVGMNQITQSPVRQVTPVPPFVTGQVA
ncbi:MAG: hypothetical protein ACLPN1_06900, partial [Dissulfurispiraceae bacterium]